MRSLGAEQAGQGPLVEYTGMPSFKVIKMTHPKLFLKKQNACNPRKSLDFANYWHFEEEGSFN